MQSYNKIFFKLKKFTTARKLCLVEISQSNFPYFFGKKHHLSRTCFGGVDNSKNEEKKKEHTAILEKRKARIFMYLFHNHTENVFNYIKIQSQCQRPCRFFSFEYIQN